MAKVLTILFIIGAVTLLFTNFSGRRHEYDYNYLTGKYEKVNTTGCTEDCSGHNAGYNWAYKKDLTKRSECTGNSSSFIEGCKDYIRNN